MHDEPIKTALLYRVNVNDTYQCVMINSKKPTRLLEKTLPSKNYKSVAVDSEVATSDTSARLAFARPIHDVKHVSCILIYSGSSSCNDAPFHHHMLQPLSDSYYLALVL